MDIKLHEFQGSRVVDVGEANGVIVRENVDAMLSMLPLPN